MADRYSRQERFQPLGKEGQLRLQSARVALCGCGALGTVIANHLVRAGVGYLRIIDRDLPELNNLQRQILFDEIDVANPLPKAVAAANKLRTINSTVTVEPEVADLDAGNIAALCGEVDLILDGTDNFETRFLINDWSIDRGIPWIYGACIGSEGFVLPILPGETACLRCLVASPPEPGTSPTCETAGILAPTSAIVASFQVAEAIKILSGHREAVSRDLLVFDLWSNRIKQLKVGDLPQRTQCPVCVQKKLDWLTGKVGQKTTSLCGRDAVQVVPGEKRPLDWAQLEARLATHGEVTANRFLMRCLIDGFEFTVFPDGRAIIKGTTDVGRARSLYARYLGT